MKDKILGGMYGAIIGDALGVPFEFHKPSQIPEASKIEYNTPVGFVRTYNVLPGTWSDDSSHILALADSLNTKGTFDVSDFSDRLVDWYVNGKYAVDNNVFDCGVQTAKAIRNIRYGAREDLSGENSNGNGSLMRMIPLPLWHKGSLNELVEFSHEQSKITHPHIRSQVCCALYALWAFCELNNINRAIDVAKYTLADYYKNRPAYLYELQERVLKQEADYKISGNGYVVNSLRAAMYVVSINDNFEETIKDAIKLGEDTDTTACIAGGIAGIKYGFDNIPDRLIDGLRGKEICNPIIEEMIK